MKSKMNEKKLLKLLMEAIDYAYLQTDGTYSRNLAYVVSDKMHFIKDQLYAKRIES